MKKSAFLSLDFKDLVKGLLMAILTPALLIVQQSLELGSLTFNWKQIAMASIAGAVAYLVKNFLTNSSDKFFSKEEIGGGGIKNPPKP